MTSKFNNQAWSQDQYNNFKNQALNSTIVRKMVSFKEINIISDKFVSFNNVEFEMTEKAFKSLVKILGLSNVALNTISDKLGEKITKDLVNALKIALSKNNEKDQLCLLVDQKTSKIVDFSKSAKGILSHRDFFNLLEDTLNNQSGMHIKNMAITDNGSVEISLLNENWEFNVPGLSDEFFKSGLVFINTPTETIINPFNERLVCTNGMITRDLGLSLILKNSDATSINGFMDTVRNLKGVANFEQEFKNRIVRMIKTKASYAELLDVRKSVENEVLNMKDPFIRDTVEDFIPTMYVKQAFLEKKIDLNMIPESKYKRINTMLTVWELVNKLTDLSSHPFKYGLTLTNGNQSVFQLQRKAGDLSFKKEYDLEDTIEQVF